MKTQKLSLRFKKNLAVFFHALFVAAILAGFSLMHMNENFGKGLSWLGYESYDDTDTFSAQFRDDIDRIFDYVKYKDVFETNNMVDTDKAIISISDGPTEQTLTLDEMLQYAKSRGYFLDDKYQIAGNPTTPTDEDLRTYMVNWRSYEPNLRYAEPGEAYSTLEELSIEVLTCLGTYYADRNKFIDSPTNMWFRIEYNGTDDSQTAYTNITENLNFDDLMNMGKYVYVSGDSVIMESNLSSIPENVTTPLAEYNPYHNSSYYMIVSVDTSYPAEDAYSHAAINYQELRSLFIYGIILACVGALGCLFTFYYLVLTSGYKTDGQDGAVLHNFDLIPTELWILLTAMGTSFALFLSEKFLYQLLHLFLERNFWYYGENLLKATVIYLCVVVGLFSLLRRYKTRTLWSGSLTRHICRSLSLYMLHKSFTIQIAFSYLFYLLLDTSLACSVIYLYIHMTSAAVKTSALVLAVLWLILNLYVFHRLYRKALQDDIIIDGLAKIAAGDTSFQIDTKIFSGKEKELADNINNISTGMDAALQEKVRSERLKADLITNVSHDIKTPLTSIINYVDLIKREKIQDPKIQGYLEVLEQKSHRLKTLTEDLVEASKASSGNVKLELADIDLVELVQQTNGEFEEKFAMRHLELVTHAPSETILVQADGRRLWRVLENLYNNAFKYSMPHSRVYIDIVKAEEGTVSFTIKNISETPLNIKSEELTERFVRGDVSRTTEGSGLGLSIAKSLTELQNGTFQLFIDGDLFKAQVTFPIKNRNVVTEETE